jgi:hypothetical protein
MMMDIIVVGKLNDFSGTVLIQWKMKVLSDWFVTTGKIRNY